MLQFKTFLISGLHLKVKTDKRVVLQESAPQSKQTNQMLKVKAKHIVIIEN